MVQLLAFAHYDFDSKPTIFMVKFDLIHYFLAQVNRFLFFNLNRLGKGKTSVSEKETKV